jgi:hypothetical protein
LALSYRFADPPQRRFTARVSFVIVLIGSFLTAAAFVFLAFAILGRRRKGG